MYCKFIPVSHGVYFLTKQPEAQKGQRKNVELMTIRWVRINPRTCMDSASGLRLFLQTSV